MLPFTEGIWVMLSFFSQTNDKSKQGPKIRVIFGPMSLIWRLLLGSKTDHV